MSFKHIPDCDIMMAIDGELSANRQREVENHLRACWTCRARRAQFDRATEDFVGWYNAEPKPKHLGGLIRSLMAPPTKKATKFSSPRFAFLSLAAASGCLVALLIWGASSDLAAATPNPNHTPGVVVPVTMAQVCQPEFAEQDRPISRELAERVFLAYGIRNPGGGHYEVDYLITPALGGAVAVGNMWPQPYSKGEWNAHVKDALEVHLRHLVCSGKLQLASAQQELAKDWIEAYKRHFGSDHPLQAHLGFVKDRPWD